MSEPTSLTTATHPPHVRALVLDATPLITQPYSHYQNYAESFYTTPTVFQEIKDAHARKNLEVWQTLGVLKLVQPSEDAVTFVSQFARLTGDYSVLSKNDIYILALTYQLECQLNGGPWRLRRKPGDSLEEADKKEVSLERELAKEAGIILPEEGANKDSSGNSGTANNSNDKEGDKGNTGDVPEVPEEKDKTRKKTRRGSKRKSKAKRNAQALAKEQERETVENTVAETLMSEDPSNLLARSTELSDKILVPSSTEADIVEISTTTVTTAEEAEGSGDEGDGDGEWITPDTLIKVMMRDSGEDTKGDRGVEATEEDSLKIAIKFPKNQVALATGDFAMQNVALQMNLNLMNFMSGMKISRLRNYMLRCHACFKLFPLPKDGKPKHFCPSCGGQGTLLRCTVSVDSKTGKVTPHLKSNFQWINRGNRYSIASPLSKNSQRKYGKKGYNHVKQNEDVVILREDQREYEQAVKQQDWTAKHNAKVLNDWTSGGSADNYISPFAITGLKRHSFQVGKGRYVNSSSKKRK